MLEHADAAEPDVRTSDARSTIGELGESAVLARILPRLDAGRQTVLGAGDDAAVVSASDGRFVVTTDLMVHGPDFRLAWSSPFDLGWKAAATNLTDVAAMGARPTALVVAIAAPTTTHVGLLEGIADGMRECLRALAPGAGVVGGDLSVSSVLTIAVTAFGDLEGRRPVLRSGARPGDVLAHAGVRGDAARGLALLFREGVDAAGEPNADRAAELRQRHPHYVNAQLAPEPPVFAGALAAEAGATAMLDVSDGLAKDAARIAHASGVVLDFDSATLGDEPAIVLGGGEDHGLLATFSADTELPKSFTRLGAVRAGAAGLALDGEAIESHGWDPYADWDGDAG